MTDKEVEYYQDRIREEFFYWRGILGLSRHHINVDYNRFPHPENTNIAAFTDPLWQYMRADITFYLPRVAQMEPEELRNVVVHELCHIVLAPLSFGEDTPQDMVEFATQCTANAILSAWESKHDSEKEAVQTQADSDDDDAGGGETS